MRFLADESCDFAVVRALRMAGHDVDAVSEIAPGIEDSEVIHMAIRGDRILLTEDKDFGQLVYAHTEKSQSVMLMRYPATARQQLAKDIGVFSKASG